MSRWLHAVVSVALCLALAACPRGKRHTLVPSVPTSGDPVARARFIEARDAFLRDGSGRADLEEIVRDFPDDPVTPFALLYAGIAAFGDGDAQAAVTELRQIATLDTVDAGLQARADLYLGLSYNALGDSAKALPYLLRSERAVEGDAERGLWIAATAVASAASPTPLDALVWLDRFWDVGTEPERGWVLARLDELVSAAPPDAAVAAWKALGRRDGPAAAVLGARVAAILEAAGDLNTAADVRRTIRPARQRLGLAIDDGTAVAAAIPAGPPHLGAVLPLDGKQSRVGEAAARGLAVAAGAHGGDSAGTSDVVDAAGAKASAAAVATLADQGVQVVIGPIDGDSVDAAAARAADLGVPLISLNPRAEERPASGPWLFHAMHSAERRAQILARRAAAQGVTRFAILAPASGYGRAVAGAFADEVKAAGGEVVVRVDYDAGEKSFTKVVKKLSGKWQAVFIPEQADRLELIAPALSAAGMVPRAVGAKLGKTIKGRPILLLSTAEGMDPDTVRDAGRHLVGGLLAPGFYPDRGDDTIAAFLDAYEAAEGGLPTAVDADAHDASLAAAAAAGAGGDRAAVARALAGVRVLGATGTVTFTDEHRRADDGVLFTVEEDGATVRTLR